VRWWLVALLCACKHPAPTLPDGLYGEWESWCVTEKDVGQCLSKEHDGTHVTFGSDGTFTAATDVPLHGRWELHGDELSQTVTVYGQTYTEHAHVRFRGDSLVMWDGDHGEIYGRVGATFEPADSPVTDGTPVVRKLLGVTYELPLPAGYRLGEATEHREMWMPKDGDGFTVEIKVNDRGAPHNTCKDFGGGRGGGSETKNGVERRRYVDIMTCLEGANLYGACEVEHTRGYLEKSEEDAAYAMCTPVKFRP
jgi:hypothetical protein